MNKLVFTGSFLEFFLLNLGLSILTLVSFGLLFIVQVYFNIKWVVEHIEIK